jgi:hypothetical protein
MKCSWPRVILTLLHLPLGLTDAATTPYKWQQFLDDSSIRLGEHIGTMDAAPPRDPRTNKRGSDVEISRSGWTSDCETHDQDHDCGLVLDDDTQTSWQAAANFGFPQNVTVHLPQPQLVSAIGILPDQEPRTRGNILAHEVYASLDGEEWSLVAYGTWAIDNLSEWRTVFVWQCY